MVQHLIKLIDEIKEKENNVLIVLKGFSDTYEPAFFPKFYDEKKFLKTLLLIKKLSLYVYFVSYFSNKL